MAKTSPLADGFRWEKRMDPIKSVKRKCKSGALEDIFMDRVVSEHVVDHRKFLTDVHQRRPHTAFLSQG